MDSISLKNIFSLSLSLFVSSFIIGQTPLVHEKTIYENEKGNVYVNKSQPVYLSISSKPDGSNGKVLKGQDPTYSYPMYLDTEGYNSIRSPWKVDPETKETIYPKQEVIFEVYADGTPPKVSSTLISEKKIYP